jgi:hypothetical protein
MSELADNMHGSIEGQQTTLTMITHRQWASACSAPPLLDFQGDVGKDCVGRPAVWHGRLLLARDVYGDDHTSHRQYRTLAL